MKNHSLNLMKLAVGLTILVGVLVILFTNESSFRKIAADDIENISKLSASTLYGEINNSLTKPIFVSQTMANDLFLKNWLAEEAPLGDDPAQRDVMRQYLSGYRDKYGYDSVVMVSAKSGAYYHQEGVSKVLHPDDAHDVWYFDLLGSPDSYKLNVDTDQANRDLLTVFVDSKISAADGSVLGVVGIGIKMSHLQQLLLNYETQYDLKALLIDANGLIQVDSMEENIETANFFHAAETSALRGRILENQSDMQIFWYPEGGSDHCLITQYVKDLGWYIIIEKNTVHLQEMFHRQINQNLFLVAVIIALVLLMISCVMAVYNRKLLRTASLDEVTNLPNLRMFQEIYTKNARRAACREGFLFLFDIDHFKEVNDHFGHLFGNTLLYRVSEAAKDSIGQNGLTARFGGDEFVGVIYAGPERARELLTHIIDSLATLCPGETQTITISIGVVAIRPESDLNRLLDEADAAMYRSKERGRNQITFAGES